MEACGEDLGKGCTIIRNEYQRDPTLRDYIDEVISNVIDCEGLLYSNSNLD